MKEFSFSSKLYILSTLAVGVVLCFKQFPDLSGTRLWLFLIVVAVTTFTQIVQVKGIIRISSYNASVFGYSLALLALGRAEAFWIVLISFLAAWIWNKRFTPWFALGFNIGSVIISLAFASLIYQFITQGEGLRGFQGVAGTIAAGGLFILLSQSMVGLIYWLVEVKAFASQGI